MSVYSKTITETIKEWLVQQGYMQEHDFDENASLGLDSFAYLAFIVQLEDRFQIAIRADLFFGPGTDEGNETFKSLCERVKRSISLL